MCVCVYVYNYIVGYMMMCINIIFEMSNQTQKPSTYC